MRAPSIVADIRITIEDVWDARHIALFGTPHSFAENICEIIKDKQIGDAAEVLSVKLLKAS